MDIGNGNPLGVDQELWPEERLDFGPAKAGNGGHGDGNNQLFDPDSLMFESIEATTKQCHWGSSQALHGMDGDLNFEASLFPEPEGNSGFFNNKNVCSPDMDVYGTGEEMAAMNPYDSSEGSLYQDIRADGAEKPPKVKYECRPYQGSNNVLGGGAGEEDSELKHSDADMNVTVPGSKSQSGISAVDSSSQTNYNADTEMCTEGAKSGKKQALHVHAAEPVKRAPSSRCRTVPKRLLDMIKNAKSHAGSSARSKKSLKRTQKQANSHEESPRQRKAHKSQTMEKSLEPVREVKAIRAASTRNKAKGQPSFSEIIKAGLMSPGPQKFCVGQSEVTADIDEDGAIYFGGVRYRAVSKFALVVLRVRNPSRQSCDGWKEVSWNGEKLDSLRSRVHQSMDGR